MHTESWVKAYSPTAGDMNAVSIWKKDVYVLGLNFGTAWVTKEQNWPAYKHHLRDLSPASREPHDPFLVFICSYLFT